MHDIPQASPLGFVLREFGAEKPGIAHKTSYAFKVKPPASRVSADSSPIL